MDDPRRAREQEERASGRKMWLIAMLCSGKEAKFKDLLEDEGRRRRHRCLPRAALCCPGKSSWERLCQSGVDQALVTAAGCDHFVFGKLLVKFKPWFETHAPWTGQQDATTWKPLDPTKHRGGRKRVIDAKGCLGLVLTWCPFRGAEFILQGWFGHVGSHLNIWLRFGQ